MGISIIKIEHMEHNFSAIKMCGRSHSRKWYKKQRNRKLRRTKQTEKPNTKRYDDYEY